MTFDEQNSQRRLARGMLENLPVSTLRGNIPHLNWARTARYFFDIICLIYDSTWYSFLNKTYVRSLGTQLISTFHSSRSNLSNSVEAYVISMGILDSNMLSMSRQENIFLTPRVQLYLQIS